MTAIEAHRLIRTFGEVVAVNDLSFTVHAGEVVGLLGANGAGKTTTMRMLLGLLPATSGEVTVGDIPVGRVDRATLGYLPQGLGLYRELTVVENLRFAAAVFDVAPLSLEEAGLGEVADRRVADIPLGLQRRVAFLIAIGHRPEVLILDEPTSGVGPLGRARLWEAIRKSAVYGAAIVVSTHHLEEAEECDRVLLLATGKEVASGTVDEVVGGATAVAVEGDVGQSALNELTARGGIVLQSGSGRRVIGVGADVVREIVGEVGVREVPATFEEAFVTLSA